MTTSNREYAIALQWVQRKYPQLHKLAEAIVLTPADMFPLGQKGQCSHDNFVCVKDERETVGDFINTLVHELTHCAQNRRGMAMTEQMREEEAYQAGILAAQEYLREASPWMKGRP